MLHREPSTLVDILQLRAAEDGGKMLYRFLLDGEVGGPHEEISYEQLYRRACQIAAWLQQHAMRGERALLLFAPGPEFIYAFYGCLLSETIAVPVYPPDLANLQQSLHGLQAIATDAGVKVVLTTEDILELRDAGLTAGSAIHQLAWTATDGLDDSLCRQWSMPDIAKGSPAYLQYTSGSEGSPKGVIVGHDNLLHNLAQLEPIVRPDSMDTTGVGWLPPYHDMGLVGFVLEPLYAGFPTTLMSPQHFMQRPLRWLRAISHFRSHCTAAPNFAYALCARKATPEDLASLDLSCLQVALNGAEPVRVDTLRRFCETFRCCGFREQALFPCYGLAEATLFVTGGRRDESPVRRAFDRGALKRGLLTEPRGADSGRELVSCGRPRLEQEVVVVEPQGSKPCEPGAIGEILVRGGSVAAGYWNQPQLSEDTFRASVEGTDARFLRTGDLGGLWDGELYVTGRHKDLVIIRGLNHHPDDVERTVEQSHQSIRPGSSAAFATEIDDRERLVVVAEVDDRAGPIEPDAILASIQAAVSGKHGIQVYAIQLLRSRSIAKTSSGKIRRHACRDSYCAGTLACIAEYRAAAAGDPPRGGSEAAQVAGDGVLGLLQTDLQELAAKVLNLHNDEISAKADMREVGFDSLAVTEFIYLLNDRYGLAVTPQMLLEHQTVRSVARRLFTDHRDKLDEYYRE